MKIFRNVKNAIKTAIQMEQDGYDFYKKAAAQTSNEMGKAVFESLSEDELVHLDVFKKIFSENIGESEWNNLISSSKKYQILPIFPKDLKSIEGANPDTNELDALHIAMDSEQEAIDFYNEILANSTADDINKALNEIIEQEKNHYFLLQEEFRHLSTTGYSYELDYLGG